MNSTPPLPLIATNGWDEELQQLQARHPALQIIVVKERSDLLSAVPQIAGALLAGREIRQRISPTEPDAVLRRALDEAQSLFAATIGTWQSRGEEWLEQISSEPRELLAIPAFSALHGALAGLPALVLGAGPSLDECAERLAPLFESSVTIAASSALVPLASRRLFPEFVVVIEARDCSHHFRPPAEPTRSTLLLAQQSHGAHRRIAARQRWRVDLAENGWFAGLLGCGPPLPSGGNVGAAAFALAARLGCAPIYLAGLDFAHGASVDHATGSPSPSFGAEAGAGRQTEGVSGGLVESSELLVGYRRNLEGMIRSLSDLSVYQIDVSAGAAIEGAQPIAPEGVRGAPLDRTLLRAELDSRHATAAQPQLDPVPLFQEWERLERMRRQLVERSAGAVEFRAELVSQLHPGSWGYALLAGFLLDPRLDPRLVAEQRLAYGADWLARFKRSLETRR